MKSACNLVERNKKISNWKLLFYGNPVVHIECDFLKAGLLDFYSYYDLATL